MATSKRAKPVAAKAGVSRNPKRRYGNGGKVSTGNSYKCGGKIRK